MAFRRAPDPMRNEAEIAVVIPALNEERSIGAVLAALPSWVDDVVVADNGSGDRTAAIARAAGARVVCEPRRGYGSACLAGIAALDDPDVVVFMDADFSDHPEEMHLLADPIVSGEADLVAGSRVLGRREAGALTPQARFGNWLACALIRLFWGKRYTDLGPFRAIRGSTLRGLGMRDPGYGWMVEMQIKATQAGVRVREVPVSYRRRVGASKISGTLRGIVGAGTKILGTIFLASIGAMKRAPSTAAAQRIVVFTRYPEAGSTKTRLIAVLGPEGAADLQRKMTGHTLAEALRAARTSGAAVELRFTGGSRAQMRSWMGNAPRLRTQGSGDLGARMARAFRDAFHEGARRVILTGSDCPGLRAPGMERALRTLEKSEVVIGPADDGGYYLIGLRREVPQLFESMPWGSDRVLAETVRRIEALGLSVQLLEQLPDVDRPEDLEIWERVGEPGDQRDLT